MHFSITFTRQTIKQLAIHARKREKVTHRTRDKINISILKEKENSKPDEIQREERTS